MSYNCKLSVLRIVTWSYNYLLDKIISYLKLENYVQTITYDQTEIITWPNE